MNKPVSKPAASNSQPLSVEEQSAYKHELGELLRARRLALATDTSPAPTQLALSAQMGYQYSIVTSFENGTRNMLVSHFKQLAKALQMSPEEIKTLLKRYEAVLLPDSKSMPNSGSRMDAQINERVKALREQHRLTLREMGDALGMTYTHYLRVEKQRGSLTVAQLRQIHKHFGVSYEYLLDGASDELTYAELKQRLTRVEAENELLQELRQAKAK